MRGGLALLGWCVDLTRFHVAFSAGVVPASDFRLSLQNVSLSAINIRQGDCKMMIAFVTDFADEKTLHDSTMVRLFHPNLDAIVSINSTKGVIHHRKQSGDT